MSKIARVVSRLPPETLHQLIQRRGLDACADLVALATPAQVTALLDLDLWRHTRPGADEQFDVARFGEWIEALVDAGDAVAARTIAGIDRELVVEGLCHYVRVFDPGIFEPTAQSDDELTDRHEAMREGDSLHADGVRDRDSIGDRLECELGGYIVRARRVDAWDAIITLLLALDGAHPDCFRDLMAGCRRLSNSRPELSGFDDLLQAPEQHLHDVAIEREHRRSQQGYATPADARAFLEMARQPKPSRPPASAHPIVRAYFRAADEATASFDDAGRSPKRELEASSGDDEQAPGEAEQIIELLSEAGVMPDRPRALLDAADAGGTEDQLFRLRQSMAEVLAADETTYLARTRELAFLANVLLAGCSVQSRPFTPQEASDAAAAICNLGLECWNAPGDTLASCSLRNHDLVAVFEAGWSVLHHEVSLFAADWLIEMRLDLDGVDDDTRLGLVAFKRALVKHREAGTPWLARDAAEILAMLDATAWAGVLGVLAECPVMPAALSAILEARTTGVSPSSFTFISTPAQIADVHRFLRKLPELLAC